MADEPGTWADVDRQLLIRLRKRDREALGAVADRYGDALTRAAYLYLHDEHAAADLVQDTLLAAWDGARRVKGETALRPWLFGILVNLCRKHQRSWIRRRRRERHVAERVRSRDGTRDDSTEEQLRRLRTALGGLDDRLRAVVVLRFSQKMSVTETSAALGIPEGTIKSRTHAAMRQLKSALEREDERKPG